MTGKKHDTNSGWYTDPKTGERVHPDDAPELTEEWFAKAEIHVGGKPVRRGRPLIHGEKAEGTTLRMPPTLKERLRQTGRGWQSRVVRLIAEEMDKPRGNRLMAQPPTVARKFAPAKEAPQSGAATLKKTAAAVATRKSAKPATAKKPLRLAAKKTPPRSR